MNFNHINRNSLMNSLYGSRNSYQSHPNTDQQLEITEEHHLNPSKSKVNIKQSLNKTIENCKMNSSIIVDIRNRSFMTNNPISANNQIKHDLMDEDKYFKSGKQANGSVTDRTFNKENTCKNYQPLPLYEQKKKAQSFHNRNASGQLRLKFEEDKRNAEQDQFKYTEVNVLLQALSKRMANNEEEIFRMKQKMQREKSSKLIDIEFIQLKSKLGQLSRNGLRRNEDIDLIIKGQHNQLQTLKELITHKESNVNKNTVRIAKVEELLQEIKDYNLESLTTEVHNIKLTLMNKVNKDIQSLTTRLDQNKEELFSLNSKIVHLDSQLNQKSKQYKKSSKMSYSSIMLQNKELLNVNFLDQSHKSRGNRSLVIKEKCYYIDTSGYLLDENKFYLLNKNNEQILLNERLLLLLKQHNILMRSNLKL